MFYKVSHFLKNCHSKTNVCDTYVCHEIQDCIYSIRIRTCVSMQLFYNIHSCTFFLPAKIKTTISLKATLLHERSRLHFNMRNRTCYASLGKIFMRKVLNVGSNRVWGMYMSADVSEFRCNLHTNSSYSPTSNSHNTIPNKIYVIFFLLAHEYDLIIHKGHYFIPSTVRRV